MNGGAGTGLVATPVGAPPIVPHSYSRDIDQCRTERRRPTFTKRNKLPTEIVNGRSSDQNHELTAFRRRPNLRVSRRGRLRASPPPTAATTKLTASLAFAGGTSRQTKWALRPLLEGSPITLIKLDNQSGRDGRHKRNTSSCSAKSPCVTADPPTSVEWADFSYHVPQHPLPIKAKREGCPQR